jgi:hypothetical protein
MSLERLERARLCPPYKRDPVSSAPAVGDKAMAMKPKSKDLEVAPEHPSEQQSRKATKAALKKADRYWRLAEKAPSENYREHHMKQAKDASTVSAEKTRQANEIRAKGA